MTVGNQSVINVALEEFVQGMDEVVVIGYGVQRKSVVTAAISSVDAETLERSSLGRVEHAIQGKSAGISVLPVSGSPGAPVPEVNYSTPFKIIRYADVLLMAAEAYNKDNQDSKAVALIKQVRERAGATDHSSWENLTGTDLFNVIVKERQLELAFEGHRFWDLVRWGLADQEIPGFVKGKHELFPIPLTEINLNSAIDLSDQNPGY